MPVSVTEIAALDLELVEEARILDGEGGLDGEGLHDVDDLGRKISGHSPAHHETAQHTAIAQERHGQQGPHAGGDETVTQRPFVRARGDGVGNLHGLQRDGDATHGPLAFLESHLARRAGHDPGRPV
jgi:hypothetical protein